MYLFPATNTEEVHGLLYHSIMAKGNYFPPTLCDDEARGAGQ